MTRVAWIAVLFATAAACGAAGDEAGAEAPDAGTGGMDSYCEMVLLPFEPSEPERGETVIAAGSIDEYGVSGIHRYEWTVSHEGTSPEVTSRGDDAIEFTPTNAGIYDVELRGSVGDRDCFPASAPLNVRALGAETVDYRFRVVPPAGGASSELDVTVPGGADYALGSIAIDTEASLSGRITGPEGGSISGYVRIRDAGGGRVESFAGDDGAFAAPRPPGGAPYELLVVPDDPGVAPALLSGLGESELEEVALSPGIEVGGTLARAAGEAVEGARVSLSVGGVPSSVGITGEEGSFSLRARPGQAIVRISAPKGSGLFDLRAPEVEIGADTQLSIRYDEASDSISAAPRATAPDGETPVPGARATWIAEPLPAAATVEKKSGEVYEASASARLSAIADDQGDMPELILPGGAYEVIVAPPQPGSSGYAASVLDVDSGDGVPERLALSQPAELGGVVRAGEEGNETIGGAKIVAIPEDPLATATGASASTKSGEEGAFSLSVAGGVGYELALSPPPGARRGRTWVSAEAPAPGDSGELGAIALPAGIELRGELSSLASGALAGAHVSVRCADCSGERADTPVAEAVSDASGRFRLVIPDPGVAEGE